MADADLHLGDLDAQEPLQLRQVGDAGGDEIDLAAELIDRFGPLPDEAGQLLKVVAIKGLCRQANVSKIDVGPKGAVIAFRGDRFDNPGGLMEYIHKHKAFWKLRPADQKVVVLGDWPAPEQRLASAERILIELAKLAKAGSAAPT